jgi:hypothetical protein
MSKAKRQMPELSGRVNTAQGSGADATEPAGSVEAG